MLKTTAVSALMLSLMASVSHAAGELNIYNWGNYTSPELIKKFEAAYDVKVTVTDYDSNDTALAKIRQGGHGFDIVVPSSQVMDIWIKEGLLLEARPDQMENFKNVDPRWVDVPFDPGRKYTAPWVWGSTGVTVNTSVYKGDINTSNMFMDPPAEVAGKVNVVPEMTDVMALALFNIGAEQCTADLPTLKKVRDKMLAAKATWVSISYSNENQWATGEFLSGVNWSGASMRGRLLNPAVQFGFPKEGFPLWMDSVGIVADAKNVDNAKLFMNFIMAPENAALISNFNRYSNGILGSEAFMTDEVKNAPEVKVPEELLKNGRFLTSCPPEVQALHTKIWTEVMK